MKHNSRGQRELRLHSCSILELNKWMRSWAFLSFCTGKAEMKTKMCLWAVIQWNENLPQVWPTSHLMVWSFSIIFVWSTGLSTICLLSHFSSIYLCIYNLSTYVFISIHLSKSIFYLLTYYLSYLSYLPTYIYYLSRTYYLSINNFSCPIYCLTIIFLSS